MVVVMLAVSIGGFGERLPFEKEVEATHGKDAVSGGFYGFGDLELVEFGLECDGEALPRFLSEV